MRRASGPFAGLVVAASLCGAVGCGDGAPASSRESSKTEATVKGVVRVAGAPATEGEVTFDPANINRPDEQPRRAAIGKDGTYTITTLVGENQIRLGGALVKKYPVASYEKQAFVVQPGENTHDIEVKGK